MRHLLSIDDLDAAAIAELLEAARRHVAERLVAPRRRTPFVTGLVFMTPSLRTRVGFTVATARLGGTAVDVADRRVDPAMTEPEAITDTIRVLTGMADVVVLRAPIGVDVEKATVFAVCPVINGGDDRGNHPTQTLIDLLAMEERGPIGTLR